MTSPSVQSGSISSFNYFSDLSPRFDDLGPSPPPSQQQASPHTLAHTTSSLPSWHVTYRVLTIAKLFRKRVAARIKGQRLNKGVYAVKSEDFCQDIEREAYGEIDRWLGRDSLQRSRKQHQFSRDPVEAFGPGVIGEDTADRIDELVGLLDQAVEVGDRELSFIAKDHRAFLSRGRFRLGPLSLKNISELVIRSNSLLEALNEFRCKNKIRTGGEGDTLNDENFDESQFANLEHLVLCLLQETVWEIAERGVEIVRGDIEHHRKQAYEEWHLDEWFFEFPDGRRPPSTTWPWCIRPSLAVIWGVCWMFINFLDPNLHQDPQGNVVDNRTGMIVVPRSALEQAGQWQHRAAYSQDPYAAVFAAGQSNMSATVPRPHRQNPRARPHSQFQRANAISANASASTLSAPHRSQPPEASWTGLESPLHTHGQDTAPSRATSSSLPAYQYPATTDWHTHTAAPPTWPPTHSPTVAPPSYSFPHPTADQVTHSWALPPDYTVPEPNLPHHASSQPLTPTRRVTSASPSHSYLGGQVSEAPIHPSPSGPIHPALFEYSGHATSLPQFNNPYLMDPAPAKMEGDTAPPVTNGTHLHENQMVASTLSRKRSHGEMVGHESDLPLMPHDAPDPYPQLQPRTLSPHDGQPMSEGIPTEVLDDTLEDGFTPMKGSRQIKRPDPPFNANHKFYCDVSPECEHLTFDRKCEWSKHMDKHDRPYRCPHPQCAKLQGFTYSGGLLRHEREVHGKHGGPKSQLICPHPDCKRHSGKGFTRRENLNEHVRRVHNNDRLDGNGPTSKVDLQAAQEAIAGAEQLASINQSLPYADGPGEPFQAEEAPMVKRPRTNGERSPSVEVDDLKLEIQRLRAQNDEKDERLRRMEIAEAQREVRLRELENALKNMQHIAQLSGLQPVESVVEQGGEQASTH